MLVILYKTKIRIKCLETNHCNEISIALVILCKVYNISRKRCIGNENANVN
jgi:hypothetical protein